ncbi:UNVERIFIED_ORG: hypothetical protein BTE55_32170 [Rhizobium sophorae]
MSLLLFPWMPEACPSTCFPGARERAGMEGANAGEHGRAASVSGTRWRNREVIAVISPANRRPCHAQAAFAGSKGESLPWLPMM